jgi:hypothetical protein
VEIPGALGVCVAASEEVTVHLDYPPVEEVVGALGFFAGGVAFVGTLEAGEDGVAGAAGQTLGKTTIGEDELVAVRQLGWCGLG